MKVIHELRSYGKTYQLIHEIQDEPETGLVVFSNQEKERIIHLYKLDRNRVFTVQEIKRGLDRGRGITKLVIDNVDLVLFELLQRNFTTITVTKDENELSGA